MTPFSFPSILVGAVLATGAVRAPSPTPLVARHADRAATVSVDSMSVDIWPEYDKPEVLLIYRGTLAPTVKPPVDFSFVVPADAQLGMVGGIDTNGAHIHAAYETRKRPDGLMEVSYTLDVRTFYMEFYYDPLGAADQRSFTYQVISPYPVSALQVNVQQPRRARGFSVTPFTNELVQDGKGFDYAVIRSDSVPPGAPMPISVSYAKKDREPSVVPQETDSSDGGRVPMKVWYVIAGAAALFVGVGGYVFVTGPEDWEEEEEEKEKRRSAVARRRAPETTRRSTPDGGFCTACGATLGVGDRYCGVCGRATPVLESLVPVADG